jgi:hypothetical protein
MSTLTLLIIFLGSLFKYQRQLVLRNLALRQQVTMLRQSVKRPRATAADRMFCSKRDVNERKESTIQPDALHEPDASHLPNPFHHITGVEYVRSVGYNLSFLLPPLDPILFPQHTIYLPANSDGVSYSARSEQLPPAAPAISYRHQSGNL